MLAPCLVDVDSIPEPPPPSNSGRPRCLILPSDDPTEAPFRLRVEREEPWGDLIELVDEPMSSRSEQAQATGLNGRVMMTLSEARWVRDALCQMLGPEGS